MRETHNMTPEVKRLTGSRKKQFGFYTGEKFSTSSYWDGGSKDSYEVVNIDTGERLMPPAGRYPFTERCEHVMRPGDILIETSIFCGKPGTPCIHCRPEDEQRVKARLGMNHVAVAA